MVISLSDGKPMRVPGLERGAWPRGWASPRQLWFTQGADFPTATRLFRVDIESGKVLEERTHARLAGGQLLAETVRASHGAAYLARRERSSRTV